MLNPLLDPEFLNFLYTMMFAFGYVVIGLINSARIPSGERRFKLACIVSLTFGFFYLSYDAVTFHSAIFIDAILHDLLLISAVVALKRYLKPCPSDAFLFNVPLFGLVLMQFAYALIYLAAESEYAIDGQWKWEVYKVVYHCIDFLMMTTLLFCKDYLGLGRWLIRKKER